LYSPGKKPLTSRAEIQRAQQDRHRGSEVLACLPPVTNKKFAKGSSPDLPTRFSVYPSRLRRKFSIARVLSYELFAALSLLLLAPGFAHRAAAGLQVLLEIAGGYASPDARNAWRQALATVKP